MKRVYRLETGEQLIIDVDDETYQKFEKEFCNKNRTVTIVSLILETMEKLEKEAKKN